MICLHIDKQIESGVNLIQIFDSWAGLLPKKELPNYCYIPILKIVDHVKSKKIPVICFPKGIEENYLDFYSTVKPDCISIDYEVDPKWIKEKLKDIFKQDARSDEDLNFTLMLITKYNIIKECYNKAEHYINLASNSLTVFKDSDEKKILENLTSFSLERNF